MSDNIALLADTHFNMWRKNNSFFKYIEDFWVYFTNYLIENDIKHVFILGDLFHTKSLISTEMLTRSTNLVFDLIENAQLDSVIMITGNHDIYKNVKTGNEYNLLKSFTRHPKIKVVADYEDVNFNDKYNFHFLSYDKNEAIIKKLKSIKLAKNKTNILFSHLGINGFKYFETEDLETYEDSSLDAKTVQKFDQVFLGHFHGYQSKNNITYISSPIQSRFKDQFSKHGFVLFNLKTNKHKFIHNPVTPQFEEITIQKLATQIKDYLKRDGSGKFLKIIINKQLPASTLHKLIQKLKNKHYNVDIKYQFDDITSKISTKMKDFKTITYNSTDELLLSFLRTKYSKEEDINRLLHTLKTLKHKENK